MNAVAPAFIESRPAATPAVPAPAPAVAPVVPAPASLTITPVVMQALEHLHAQPAVSEVVLVFQAPEPVAPAPEVPAPAFQVPTDPDCERFVQLADLPVHLRPAYEGLATGAHRAYPEMSLHHWMLVLADLTGLLRPFPKMVKLREACAAHDWPEMLRLADRFGGVNASKHYQAMLAAAPGSPTRACAAGRCLEAVLMITCCQVRRWLNRC